MTVNTYLMNSLNVYSLCLKQKKSAILWDNDSFEIWLESDVSVGDNYWGEIGCVACRVGALPL